MTNEEKIKDMGFEICEWGHEPDDMCESCKKENIQMYFASSIDGDGVYWCLTCIIEMYDQNEHDQAMIKELERIGHASHCSHRMVLGDGECECDFYKKGYDPDAWMKGNNL